MNFLDVRTLVSLQAVIFAVCALVVATLWVQHRKRFPGLALWVADYLIQPLTPMLIALRGRIPDWASIVLANVLGISGSVLLLIGLERFFNRPGRQAQNYALVALFGVVHAYFTFGSPNLAARNVNLSLALLALCGQCAWLLLRRIDPGQRRAAGLASAVFLAFSLVSVLRIVVTIAGPRLDNDFFRSNSFQSLMLLTYQVLFILLTFSLVLLVNGRLLQEVRTEEEKFIKAFQSSPAAMILTRPPAHGIVEVNDAFERISGYGRAEALGKTALELHLWAREEERAALLETLGKGGSVREEEHRFLTKSGETVVGLLSVATVTIDGAPWLLSSISDVTERTRAQERLREQSAEMERFAYTISHDLKSPLVTVRTFLGYLEEDLRRQDAAGVRGDLKYMHTAAEKMGRMLDELLELSRLGRIVSAPERMSFRELVDEALQLVAGRIAQRGVAVQVADATLALQGDRARLVEVWQNLVDNAVKFMGEQPAPRVEIGVEHRDGETVFFVRDNGIGIAPDAAERVFGLFSKLDPGSEGSGVGLAVVKKIVEMHGGRVWVEPAAGGRGSCFRFTLPSALDSGGRG